MSYLRWQSEKLAPLFHKGGKLEKFYPLFEAGDTLLYTPSEVTKTASHVRDGLDLKRMMTIVVIALVPCMLFAMYNTGYQAHLAYHEGYEPLADGPTRLYLALSAAMGQPFDSTAFLPCFLHGAAYFFPILIVCFASGGAIEVASAILRKHEVNEGFFVTGMLIPLIVPATIPLWQVALGTAFGVIFGKEVFGGTGMNFLNPALVTRAFLFFAYPAYISGNVWIAAHTQSADNLSGATLLTDALSGATMLAYAAATPDALANANWWQAFWGFIPGSMGETSAFLCFVGGVLLLATRVASWRTMLGVTLGTAALSTLFNVIGSDTNPMFQVPFHWHIVLGGWALGTVFMATDPVSSAFTETGKFWYGVGIGLLVVLIRVVNPAYPEGMMLAILFMNMFAPLIDHFVVQANIKRRLSGYAA